MDLEIGDIVLCTVEKIDGTVVFVKIEGHGEGSIVVSEIAPGRIRNLRQYVVPKKRIVCKVLRINGNHIDLSLRRVIEKERKEVMDQSKQEKRYQSLLRSILGDKAKDLIEKIEAEQKLSEFLEEVKLDSKKIEKLVDKESSKKILDVLNSEKEKKVFLKKTIKMKTNESNGLDLIKEILGEIKNAEIKYISAGTYSVKVEDTNLKSADNKLKEILNQIETLSKNKDFEFSVKENKK